MPSHVGIEACIVLLTATLLVMSEARRCILIVSKHQIVADSFVLLTSVEEVGKRSLAKLPSTLSQALRIIDRREVLLPLCSKLNKSAW